MLSGKIFFITGSTGRLGCATAYRLEELGATIVPLVFGNFSLKPKRTNWKARSNPLKINNLSDLDKLAKPDYVINFHWQLNRKLTYTEQITYEIHNNIHQIAFLWEWLLNKKIRCFVNISSIKIFSYLNHDTVYAWTEPCPVTPYGIAKMVAEKFFDTYFNDSPFQVIHLRLCSVASFGEHPSHLISQLYSSAFNNRHITINKGHITYIIYIDEVVDLIINAALIAEQQRYIITNSGMPIEQIASKFEQVSGKKINASYIDLEPGKPDPVLISDIKKLKADWIRYTSIESAIKKIIEFNQKMN